LPRLDLPAPGGISGPGKAKPGSRGELVGCAAGSARFGWLSGPGKANLASTGASGWVARLDLPASVGFRTQEEQNQIVWRFLVLWRLIFRRGIRFGSFDGRRVPVSGAFSPWNLDSRVLSSRKTNVERPREPITPPIPPFDAGFDFRDQNPPLERRVLASVQRCNQVMQRGSEP
jgi:hypothetical protein